jgi:hypothetical protein
LEVITSLYGRGPGPERRPDESGLVDCAWILAGKKNRIARNEFREKNGIDLCVFLGKIIAQVTNQQAADFFIRGYYG